MAARLTFYSGRKVPSDQPVAMEQTETTHMAERDVMTLSEVYGHEIEVLTHPVSGRLLILPKR